MKVYPARGPRREPQIAWPGAARRLSRQTPRAASAGLFSRTGRSTKSPFPKQAVLTQTPKCRNYGMAAEALNLKFCPVALLEQPTFQNSLFWKARTACFLSSLSSLTAAEFPEQPVLGNPVS